MASYLDCNMPMCKKIIILIFILFSIIAANAQRNIYENVDTTATPLQETVEAPVVEETNTYNSEEVKEEKKYLPGWGEDVLGDTSINFRTININQDSIAILKENNKYAWIKNIDSALHAAQNKDKNKPQETYKENDNSPSSIDKFFASNVLQVFLWIMAGGFIVFIIYHLFLSKGLFGKASKRSTTAVVDDELVEHLDNDFDLLFNKAYSAGDNRLAMRYLFLKTLQKLNDKELIQFAADKTNSLYAKEIPAAKRNAFAQIALYYEYIWYGNAVVNTQTFDTIKNKVNTFINTI